MATRLPDVLPSSTPQGARPSTAVAAPTDFGLGAVANGVTGYAQAKQKADDIRDDKIAGDQIAAFKTSYEPDMAARAEAYDGSQPGFAQAEIARLNGALAPHLDQAQSPGVRAALSRQADALKTQIGDHVVQVEGAKRADQVRAQKIATDDMSDASAMSAYAAQFAQLQRQRQTQSGTLQGWASGSAQDHDTAAAAALEGLDDAGKARMAAKLEGLKPAVIAKSATVEQSAMFAQIDASTRHALDTWTNAVNIDPAGYDTAVAALPDMVGALPPDLRDKFQSDAKGQLATAYVQGLLNAGHADLAGQALASGRFKDVLDPATQQALESHVASDLASAAKLKANFDGDASTAGGFDAAVGFVMDDLEGGDALVADDNGRGATRFGVNQAANPGVDVRNLTRDQATAVYKSKYWDAIGGDKLPPALGLVAFDAAVNQGPDKAKAWLVQSGGDVEQYLALRRADYQRLAASSPAQAKNLNTWLNRLGSVAQRADRINGFMASDSGFADDPLNYARGGASKPALITVPAVNAAAVLDGADPVAWGQAMKARAAAGQTLAQQYGVPPRMLTNGERKILADRLTADPGAGVTLARAALQGLGGAGTASLLREIGDAADAPVQIHIANLAAQGGDSQFAAAAARGLTLKAKGAKLDADPNDSLAALFAQARPAFAKIPQSLLSAQAAAAAAKLADQQAGVAHPDSYYVIGSLGGATINGRTYGGVATVNGVKTPLPAWLNGDYLDDSLRSLAQDWTQRGNGPVTAAGKPMSSTDVARLRPIAQPNGRFQLVDKDNRAATAKTGYAFEFDFDANRAFLRTRLGEAAVRK